jgi:hypothetical protein
LLLMMMNIDVRRYRPVPSSEGTTQEKNPLHTTSRLQCKHDNSVRKNQKGKGHRKLPLIYSSTGDRVGDEPIGNWQGGFLSTTRQRTAFEEAYEELAMTHTCTPSRPEKRGKGFQLHSRSCQIPASHHAPLPPQLAGSCETCRELDACRFHESRTR